MKFPVRTIPDGLKPRDFFVYSLKRHEDGYHTRPNIPTLVGQLKSIEVSATGFARYSMIRLIPIMDDELFNEEGMPHRRARHKHGGHDVVTPGDYMLALKNLPKGWFGVDLGPIRAGIAVIDTFGMVDSIAMDRWIPYRPDNPLGRQYPWGCAFEKETDAVAFQAHLSANGRFIALR